MFSSWLLVLFAVAVSARAEPPVSIRVLLGAIDAESASWDGGVRARGATIVSIEPWRFEGTDALNGSRWRISTHPVRRFGAANQGAPALRVKLTGTRNSPGCTLSRTRRTYILRSRAPQGCSFHGRTMRRFRGGRATTTYAEQEDGQIVWASPMWITYNPKQ
jgi:hypothetical protein